MAQDTLTRTYDKPLPHPTPLSRPFWEALKRNEFRLQTCTKCGTVLHPPKIACVKCHSRELEWRIVPTRGTVYTYTIVHRPPVPAFKTEVPYAVALVDIEGTGARVLSNLIAPLDQIHVGMPVEVVFDHVTPELSLFRFKPAGGAR